jgi:hypothetical protein
MVKIKKIGNRSSSQTQHRIDHSTVIVFRFRNIIKAVAHHPYALPCGSIF